MSPNRAQRILGRVLILAVFAYLGGMFALMAPDSFRTLAAVLGIR